MNRKRPEPDDPMMLVGVSLPADLGSLREMATTIADEFAAVGFTEERLLDLFRQPFYAAPYRAYQSLGEVEIRRIVRESLSFWGGRRVTIRDSLNPEESLEGLVRIGPRNETPARRADDEEA